MYCVLVCCRLLGIAEVMSFRHVIFVGIENLKKVKMFGYEGSI